MMNSRLPTATAPLVPKKAMSALMKNRRMVANAPI